MRLTPKPSSLNAARREAELEALHAGQTVDVLVIGGGVTGAGVALDAATRGLRVALVERRDLAHGTSRWSSKLIHGGLRYLARGHVGIAYESSVERDRLLSRTAPHLTRPLGMIAPVGPGFTVGQAVVSGTGFLAGDVLRMLAGTSAGTLPRPRLISANETRLLFPAVRRRGLRPSLLSWDGQLTDDARLVVAIARTAAAFGARVLTYVRADEVTPEGARVTDERSGVAFDIHARHVVNATGVWAAQLHHEVELRPSKGAHLVVDAARLGHPRAAITVPVPGEFNRYVFALPTLDGRVYIGLTDDPVDQVSDAPTVNETDETFLLGTISRALDEPLTPEDVIGSFAGLRPLLAGPDGSTADLSREHRILERDDGLLTLVGGKLTTYRRMAEDVVDRIVARRGVTAGRCVTASQPLVGAAPRKTLAGLDAPHDLVARLGTEAAELVEASRRDPSLAGPVAPGSPVRLGELVWARDHEGALTVDDVLDRRTRLGLVPRERAAAERAAAEVMADRPRV